MNALYKNEFGEYEPCKVLSCPIGNFTFALIELDSERGYCSSNLIDED